MFSLRSLRIDQVHPNNWNFNRLSPSLRKKLRNGMREVKKETGTFLPILVRPHPELEGEYQIVDGENRYLELKEHFKKKKIPAIVADLPDSLAKQLTSTLNYIRGEKDDHLYANFLADLVENEKETVEHLASILPEEEAEIRNSIESRISSDEETTEFEETEEETTPSTDAETFVERSFRLPISAAKIVDEAVNQIASSLSGKNIEGRALELMAADFLGGDDAFRRRQKKGKKRDRT